MWLIPIPNRVLTFLKSHANIDDENFSQIQKMQNWAKIVLDVHSTLLTLMIFGDHGSTKELSHPFSIKVSYTNNEKNNILVVVSGHFFWKEMSTYVLISDANSNWLCPVVR